MPMAGCHKPRGKYIVTGRIGNEACDAKGAFISGSTFLIDGGATASYYYGPLKPSAQPQNGAPTP